MWLLSDDTGGERPIQCRDPIWRSSDDTGVARSSVVIGGAPSLPATCTSAGLVRPSSLCPRDLRGRVTLAASIAMSDRFDHLACTLTHEIIHLERGPAPQDAYFGAVEEQLVGILAARRLIPLPALVDALAWVGSEDHHDLADELWVDVDTLRTRLQHLTPEERAHITRELARRRP